MKVLVLIDETVNPDAQDVASRRFKAVVEEMARADLHPHLVTLRGWGVTNDVIEKLGYDTSTLSCSRNLTFPLAVARLARLIRTLEIDVIHSFEVIPALAGGCAAIVARRGLRVFFRSHTSSDGMHARASRVAGRLNHVTTGGSRAVIAFARDLDRTPDRKLCPSLNGVVPPRAVSVEEVDKLRRELGIGEGDQVLLTVARLREEKGVDHALRALALLDGPLRNRLHYVVVGSGPEENQLRSLAASVPDARVHWIGHRDEIAPWYSLADVVVVPSRREAFGLPAAEAMSYSRPVVATAVGGLEEIVDNGQTGLLVPPNDPRRLADALSDLLSSVDRGRSMGKSAFVRYEQVFTMEKMIERWVHCYELSSRRIGQAAA